MGCQVEVKQLESSDFAFNIGEAERMQSWRILLVSKENRRPSKCSQESPDHTSRNHKALLLKKGSPLGRIQRVEADHQLSSKRRTSVVGENLDVHRRLAEDLWGPQCGKILDDKTEASSIERARLGLPFGEIRSSHQRRAKACKRGIGSVKFETSGFASIK